MNKCARKSTPLEVNVRSMTIYSQQYLALSIVDQILETLQALVHIVTVNRKKKSQIERKHENSTPRKFFTRIICNVKISQSTVMIYNQSQVIVLAIVLQCNCCCMWSFIQLCAFGYSKPTMNQPSPFTRGSFEYSVWKAPEVCACSCVSVCVNGTTVAVSGRKSHVRILSAVLHLVHCSTELSI